MTTKKQTAVQWSWRDDKGNWVLYDANMTSLLEDGFQKGTKKVKVDKERFIDLDLDFKEISENFQVKKNNGLYFEPNE